MNKKHFIFCNKYKHFIIVVFIAIIVMFVYLFLHKNNVIINSVVNKTDENNYVTTIKIKDDSLSKFGLCAIENYVVTDNADVRRTPNRAMYNSVYKLRFGTLVYTKEKDEENEIEDFDKSILDNESRDNYVAIYAEKPFLKSDKPVGYVFIEDIFKKETFENYVPKPKKEVEVLINSEILSVIESNYIIDGEYFSLSKDIKKKNESIVYGDFNNDANNDFAVILENLDATSSMVYIYLNTLGENNYKLAYHKKYENLLKIKLIKKEEGVMVNSEITKFPIDGVLITNSVFNSFYHIFNDANTTFLVMPN